MTPVKIMEFRNPNWGIAFSRISNAMHEHAPEWVTWTTKEDEADILLVHLVGTNEVRFLEKTKPKIIIQHCYFTAKADSIDYPKFWHNAKLTVSFHNLPAYTNVPFNFCALPWGADPDVFLHMNKGPRKYIAMVTGEIAETESLDKVFEAVKNLNVQVLHTGRDFGWDRRYYENSQPMPNSIFVQMLNNAYYIPSLREVEGFELMAIEGLMCGARPIIYDLDTYRWYRKHAVVIDHKKDVTSQLIEIFKNPPKPVSLEERQDIVNTFGWPSIMKHFYERVQEACK